MAVERMRTCESVDELEKELGVTHDASTSGAQSLRQLKPAKKVRAQAHTQELTERKSFSSSDYSPRRRWR
jgi:hypothetical protein